FYSWRQGLLESALENYTEAVLINSSFYVLDVGRFLAILRPPLPASTDVRGLTVSWELGFHAQSYFLQLSQRAMLSDEFQRFWQEMTPLSVRQEVIGRYELGLSAALSQRFRIDSIFQPGDYEKFVMIGRKFPNLRWTERFTLASGYDQFRIYLNPSLLLWDC